MVLETWDEGSAHRWLPAPSQGDDKYRRGVLAARVGSARYPGAAVLAVTAAWRTGAGLVRFVSAEADERLPDGLPSPAAAVLAARPETVFGAPSAPRSNDTGADGVQVAAQKLAWLIGCGTDPALRLDAESAALRAILRGSAPVVADAGALTLATEPDVSAPRILTPHRGEFERLWAALGLAVLPQGWPERGSRGSLEPLIAGASQLAEHTGATVLLKGSVTVAASPGGRHLSIGPVTSRLATAGTGDVLAGILGALVAGHADAIAADPELLLEAGATAAWLHDRAARIAAGPGVGRPIVALDVAQAVPEAIARLLGE